MTSRATKLRRQQATRSRVPRWARYLAATIGGAILGVSSVHWFAQLLPGPHVEAMLEGHRPQSGSGVGCTFYSLVLINDKAVEYLYLKLQVPNKITGYKVGFIQEGYSPPTGKVGIQAFEEGRNGGGECDIIQAAVNDTIDMQSSASGNMIEIHISKLSPRSVIMGELASPSYSSSVNPPETYFEGTYEYTILGQRVLHPLQFRDRGVKNAR